MSALTVLREMGADCWLKEGDKLRLGSTEPAAIAFAKANGKELKRLLLLEAATFPRDPMFWAVEQIYVAAMPHRAHADYPELKAFIDELDIARYDGVVDTWLTSERKARLRAICEPLRIWPFDEKLLAGAELHAAVRATFDAPVGAVSTTSASAPAVKSGGFDVSRL